MKFPYPRHEKEFQLHETKELDRLKRAYMNACCKLGQKRKKK